MYYKIHHIQLSAVDSFSVGKGRHYVVVWSGELPLGHVWINSPVRVTEKIHAAIQPALIYYSEYGSSLSFGKVVKLTVVICTRHRPQSLQKCLLSLLSGPDTEFELIVVDNAPENDETWLVAKQFPQVRYVREDRKGLDIARNTGARTATGDIIAYTDDDVVIPQNWITNLKACFSDPLIMAVTGLVIPASLDTRAQYTFEKKWGFNKGYLPKRFNHRYFLDKLEYGVPAWDIGAGANMAFRKEAFQVAGIFDERLDVGASGCSGDSEMWHRILAEGWDCYYIPELYVYHEHRSTGNGLRKQLFGYMRGHVAALLVQYENYQDTGELKRLREGLPQYYKQRLRQWLKGNREEYIRHIITEIRGCKSGIRFYEAHKHLRRQDIQAFPMSLLEPVATGMDLVTVIIPCYNHGHYLRQAIESGLGQSWPHMEIIVVDDGSTDGTAVICKEYKDRVKYVYVERVGLSAARNIGVQYSRGKFLIFLDADDYLYPGAAEINLFYFRYYPQLAFVSGAHDRVAANGDLIAEVYHSGDGYLSLLQGNFIGMEGCILYRRDLFFHFHFDTTLKACEDYDLNLKIARVLPTFHHKEKVSAYRIHGRNMSDNREMMLQLVRKVLKRQIPLLLNEEERLALQTGQQNWEAYYEFRIPDQPPVIAPLAGDIQRPLWSVMIPTYNCSHYLEATLKSVLDQDLGPDQMQIEVVDDCSTDGDIAALVASIGQGRVSFYRQPENRGSLRNFETCLNRAKGHFVHLLHGDDLSGHGIYKQATQLFKQYPDAGAICTGFSYINEQGVEINKSHTIQAETGLIKDWLTQIATAQKMQPPAVLVRRSVYEKLGSFFGIHYGEDWEMWVRIAAHYPVVYTPERLAFYRVHTSNITSRYFLSCQHILDISKVIDLIQPYLPATERSRLKRQAQYNWSLYFARTTDMTYHKYNAPAQAFNQAEKAFRMHQNKVTFYYLCKNLLKIMLRYKQ